VVIGENCLNVRTAEGSSGTLFLLRTLNNGKAGRVSVDGTARYNRGMNTSAPALNGVLETCLYVADLDQAIQFYTDVLGLRRMQHDERFCAFDVAGRSVLILFARGKTLEPTPVGNGFIPPHDGSGPAHCAFSITAAVLDAWVARLAAHGVPVESRVTWPRGGHSVFFRDPDGHLLELVTPGTWDTY